MIKIIITVGIPPATQKEIIRVHRAGRVYYRTIIFIFYNKYLIATDKYNGSRKIYNLQPELPSVVGITSISRLKLCNVLFLSCTPHTIVGRHRRPSHATPHCHYSIDNTSHLLFYINFFFFSVLFLRLSNRYELLLRQG